MCGIKSKYEKHPGRYSKHSINPKPSSYRGVEEPPFSIVDWKVYFSLYLLLKTYGVLVILVDKDALSHYIIKVKFLCRYVWETTADQFWKKMYAGNLHPILVTNLNKTDLTASNTVERSWVKIRNSIFLFPDYHDQWVKKTN